MPTICQVSCKTLFICIRFILPSHCYYPHSAVEKSNVFLRAIFFFLRKTENNETHTHTHRHTHTLNFKVVVSVPEMGKGIFMPCVQSCPASRMSEGRTATRQAGVPASLYRDCRYISPGLWQVAFLHTELLARQTFLPLSSQKIETAVLHNRHQQCWFCRASDQD